MKADVNHQITAMGFDGAMAIISTFETKYPNHPGVGQLEAIRKSVKDAAVKELNSATENITKARENKNYSGALSYITRFRDNVKYAAAETELRKLEDEINAEVDKKFAETSAAVVEKLKILDFTEARNALNKRKLDFMGTSSSDKVEHLQNKIVALKSLHAEAVSQINKSGAWKVPEGFGVKDLKGRSVVAATLSHVVLAVGPAKTQKEWLALGGDGILKLYKRYIPDNAKEKAYISIFEEIMGQ
jgi:hypothetical protein